MFGSLKEKYILNGKQHAVLRSDWALQIYIAEIQSLLKQTGSMYFKTWLFTNKFPKKILQNEPALVIQVMTAINLWPAYISLSLTEKYMLSMDLKASGNRKVK